MNSIKSLLAFVVCSFAASAIVQASDQLHANRQPRRTLGFVQPANSDARLVVRRAADLGNFIWVDLYVDGVSVANIGYGDTYQGSLPPGRHVLSVLPTPDPKWPTPWQMILDVQSGQTYNFTAMGNSGHLILQPPGEPEIPHGR